MQDLYPLRGGSFEPPEPPLATGLNEDIDPDVRFHSTNINTKFHCIYIIFKNIIYPIPILQLTDSLTSPDDYGLYINTQVALWLDSRSYSKHKPLREVSGFVIVTPK